MIHLCSDRNPENWPNVLPFVTMAYNSVNHASTGETLFFLFLGRDPIRPNELNITNRNRDTEENQKYLALWKASLEMATDHQTGQTKTVCQAKALRSR